MINKYNWEGINYPSEKDDWKKIEKNNLPIALNILHTKGKRKYPVYVSKWNSKHGEKKFLKLINFVMPSENTKIFEFNQYQISDKGPFIIYTDLESLIKKIDECKSNPENSCTIKVGEHIPSRFSMSTMSSIKMHRKQAWYIQR